MDDFELLVREGDLKFDKYDYPGAIQDYRAALMVAGPDRGRTQLRQVEDAEQLQFRRQLRQKYPDSIEAHMMEINSLIAIGRSRNAFRLLSELLKRLDLSPGKRLEIHEKRLELAFTTEQYEHLLEDFRSSWDLTLQLSFVSGQGALLTIISENARKPDTIPILEMLASDEQFPDFIREYLAAKINEIQKYHAARENLK